jgi:hypothetical protein
MIADQQIIFKYSVGFTELSDCIESFDAQEIIENSNDNVPREFYLFLLDILQPNMGQNQDVMLWLLID